MHLLLVRDACRNLIELLASRLEAAGVKVLWDDALDGARRFYSEDPWGNRLELLAPVN